MTKSVLPKIPASPPPSRESMTKMEQYYYAVLMHWYRYRDVPPSLDKIAALCRPVKSHTAVRAAFLSLEEKGYLKRNKQGQFEVRK